MPTAPARPGDEAWSPNGAPTNRSVPPTLPGPNSNPAPPPNPDPPKPSKPENFADGPKGPGWPPPASIPAPPVPPASSPPVPPLPPPKETDGKTTKDIKLTRADQGYKAVLLAGGEKNEKEIAGLDYTLADLLTPALWLRQEPQDGR